MKVEMDSCGCGVVALQHVMGFVLPKSGIRSAVTCFPQVLLGIFASSQCAVMMPSDTAAGSAGFRKVVQVL